MSISRELIDGNHAAQKRWQAIAVAVTTIQAKNINLADPAQAHLKAYCESVLASAFAENQRLLVAQLLTMGITPPQFVQIRANQKTPLRWSVEEDQPDVFDLLVSAGANPLLDRGHYNYGFVSTTAQYIEKTKKPAFVARLIVYNDFHGEAKDLPLENLIWLRNKLSKMIAARDYLPAKLPRLLRTSMQYRQLILIKERATALEAAPQPSVTASSDLQTLSVFSSNQIVPAQAPAPSPSPSAPNQRGSN